MSTKQIFCKQTLNMFGIYEAKLEGDGWLSLGRWVNKFRELGGYKLVAACLLWQLSGFES